jgi:hypothetical protein
MIFDHYLAVAILCSSDFDSSMTKIEKELV